jgi:cytochrome oxidase assembly protein ShyY1
VYRFLLTPRWLGAAALAVAAAVVMVMLGNWQLHRYQERTAINDRIDAADSVQAVPLTSIMPAPTAASTAGASPGKRLAWTKVTVTGRYDTTHEIQARGRTVDGNVGFEIVTPLLLTDGTAVLVDRGWVPAPEAGALAPPVFPPAPSGDVTVVGQIHLSESRPAPIERRNDRLDTRRIAVPGLAAKLPYPVYGAYVLLTEQTPAADPAFTQVPIPHEDSWQNGGYAVQWWLFAVMALFAFGWQARKEAQGDAAPTTDRPHEPSPAAPRSGDRVEEADRRRAAAQPAPPPVDRVEEADRKRAAANDRVAEADRKRAAADDRVAEADRKRAAR